MRIIEKMEQKRKKYVIFTYFFCVKSIVNDEFYCYDYDDRMLKLKSLCKKSWR